jgi:hypothetical protein
MMTDTPPVTPAIPAATLVVFRDVAGGAPELLLVERAKAMAFAGGALVFPGGRVDPGDHALAAMLGRDRCAHRRDPRDDRGGRASYRPLPNAA